MSALKILVALALALVQVRRACQCVLLLNLLWRGG